MEALANDVGTWVGLLLTLMILSEVVGDNALARAAQSILVGAGLGYGALITWEHVLQPRLLAPLEQNPGAVHLWVPLLLGILLWVAGGMAMLQPADRVGEPAPWWRTLLYGAGRIPVLLLLATTLGVALFGGWQGTLVPQFWHAARIAFGQQTGAQMVGGMMTLLITAGTLLALHVDRRRHLAQQPVYVRRLLQGWIWLGERALWFAAGLLFARLLAARFSLLIDRLAYLLAGMEQLGLGRWLGRF
ncbi:hypothetical protein FKZ61_004920 [Litorilinea aerophila]|uniref:Uncharacterized protein n=1 Tax=Litorilinea aerophila TaxID=1204385 RepID=A0A540VJP7_9CHLR|nr:hypothetical protein [Litorilinea aerophila]MCC9075453.1 hypothetical protein [Litorilinea aerophila]GIV76335.1 MAG: hypothetical protein KatS3mg050_0729 [Litorilinea sp.]